MLSVVLQDTLNSPVTAMTGQCGFRAVVRLDGDEDVFVGPDLTVDMLTGTIADGHRYVGQELAPGHAVGLALTWLIESLQDLDPIRAGFDPIDAAFQAADLLEELREEERHSEDGPDRIPIDDYVTMGEALDLDMSHVATG